MMGTRISGFSLVLALGIGIATPAQGQFVKLVTDFNGTYSGIVGEAEVVFRDPTVSGSTRGLDTTLLNDTFLADTAGYGAFLVPHSPPQAMLTAFGWQNPEDPSAWVRLITNDTDDIPNPAIHLGGKVRVWIGARAWTSSSFTTPVNNGNLFVGLGVRETGAGVPQGLNGGTAGDVEWVGLSGKAAQIFAGTNGICNTTADPTTDDVQVNPPGANVGFNGVCIDAGTNGIIDTTEATDDQSAVVPRGMFNLPSDGVAREYVFDLPALETSGNVFSLLGDGALLATPNNRGTMEHLTLTNDAAVNGPAGAKIWVLTFDDVTFESPVLDPPVIVSDPNPIPLQESVDLEAVESGDLVEVFRRDIDGGETLRGSDTANGSTITVTTATLGNETIFARRTKGTDVSDNSEPVVVVTEGNGPIRLAMAIRETDAYDNALACGDDGTGFDADQPSTLEFIGCESTSGFGIPDGRRIRPEAGWREVLFDPCTDGVTVFSGDGEIFINSTGVTKSVWEGLYYRIDDQTPTTGPYTLYIDDVQVLNAEGLGFDCLIDDFESYTPGEYIVEGAVTGGVGGTGSAASVAEGDDVQIVAPGGTTFLGQIIIAPGPNGVLDTTPATDEGVSSIHARFNFPGTSGTSVGLADSPDVCAVTDEEAFSGTQSLKVQWAFTNAANLNSVARHTTNGSTATNPPETFLGPDPVIELTHAACDNGIPVIFSFMLLFEPAPVPADANADGNVDLADYAQFQLCFGASAPFSEPCGEFDLAPNGMPDGTIDLQDYTLFGVLTTGPR